MSKQARFTLLGQIFCIAITSMFATANFGDIAREFFGGTGFVYKVFLLIPAVICLIILYKANLKGQLGEKHLEVVAVAVSLYIVVSYTVLAGFEYAVLQLK